MVKLEKQFMYQEKLLTLLRTNSSKIILVFGGLLLLTGGFFISKNFASSDKVEILSDTKVATGSGEIVVEVSGAVLSPGVYKLSLSSRIDDAILAAGGLSEDADRGWVERTINKASKVTDGQKIYIKDKDEVSKGGGETQVLGQGSGLVNINEATQKELEELPGIGPVYASKIIEHRPYSTIEEMVSKKAIGQSVFEKIKDKISVY